MVRGFFSLHACQLTYGTSRKRTRPRAAKKHLFLLQDNKCKRYTKHLSCVASLPN